MTAALVFLGIWVLVSAVAVVIWFRERVVGRPTGRLPILMMGVIGVVLVAMMITLFIARGGHP